MNVYDNAHDLARVLKNCPEVIELREASKKIENNETAKKMLDDFRKIQFEAYSEQMQSNELSKGTKEKFQSLASVISMNSEVSAYLQAEQKFGVMWEDIMKILNEAVNVDLTFGIK